MSIQRNNEDKEINREPKLHDISTYLFSNDIIYDNGFLNLDFKISEDLSRELDEKVFDIYDDLHILRPKK